MTASQALSVDSPNRIPQVPPSATEPGRVRRGTAQVPHHRIVILGAGFAGVGMAIRLLQSGERDFVVLERATDVGGTWRDNTYPGCQCDVPSNLYSFSFAPNPEWTREFAWQGEIFSYIRGCVDRFGVRPHLRLETELLEAKWDDAAQHWRIDTSKGPVTADFLVSGHGGLSAPSVPELPGLDRFEGTVFHSAAWNHEHSLAGERVAVVGTGASAIQIVPAIQPIVSKLVVYQRTPPWVAPRFDQDVSEAKRSWYRRLPAVQKLSRIRQYLLREVLVSGMTGRSKILGLVEKVARRHLESQVPDPELRARLTPNYAIGCKRILISNDYYPALTKPNVEVVTHGIREVTSHGVVDSEGTFREVDTLVLCTGFKVTDHPITHRIRGRDGRTLAEHWVNGSSAYLGTTVSGFPNAFLITGPHTGLGHTSMIYMMEAQFTYILGALEEVQKRQAATLDVREEAVRAFGDEMQGMLKGSVWNSGCASWYLDKEGRNTTVWPTFTWRFKKRTRHFDAAPYAFEKHRAPAQVAEGVAA